MRPRKFSKFGYGRQSGVTLVELMISLTLGLILLAALLTVFSNSSAARSELERTSRQIENGRYAIQLLADDLRVAGFYGELNVGAMPVPAVLPDPCSTNPADWNTAIPLHLQGYDDGNGAPACLPISAKPNSDVFVVRRVKTCAAGVAGCETVAAGRPYLQASLCITDAPQHVLGVQGTAAFPLRQKDCATAAVKREYMVNVYYISTDNGSGQNVPTLTRLELSGGAIVQVPLVEGIEEMNVEYGIDTDGDGQPDAYSADPTNFTFAGCTNCTPGNNWSNVVTANLHVLARSVDPSPGHADTRTYRLGLNAGGVPVVFGPTNDRYRRNVYSAMVRIANSAGRRDAP
ncbi:MAG TPA: PilW family protein [Burkholderiales bacterium]|jgi:type IV pilus assembly protein PilW|nr:PilW family protein [Burkholderiales bacterium]